MRLFRDVKSKDALVLRFFANTSKAQLMNMAMQAVYDQDEAACKDRALLVKGLEDLRWNANVRRDGLDPKTPHGPLPQIGYLATLAAKHKAL